MSACDQVLVMLLLIHNSILNVSNTISQYEMSLNCDVEILS